MGKGQLTKVKTANTRRATSRESESEMFFIIILTL
jgi:hypothetical protein